MAERSLSNERKNGDVEPSSPTMQNDISRGTSKPRGVSQSRASEDRKREAQFPAFDSGDRESKSGNDNQEHWTALIKDRNRLNAQKSRKKQQEQLSHLEAENTRLSVSNDALRYHNRHLQDAIKSIKAKASQQPYHHHASTATHRNVALSSQHATPNVLHQQQLAALMMANDTSSRIIPQALALTAAAFASNPELAALLQPGATPGGNAMGLAARSTAAYGQQDFCCNEYRAFCALDPSIQHVYQGDRHHPLCSHYRK